MARIPDVLMKEFQEYGKKKWKIYCIPGNVSDVLSNLLI
jgi:hypothetical protein